MSEIERYTIWLMPDSRWPYSVERGSSEREIAGADRVEVVPAGRLREAAEALREVARLLDRSTQTGAAPTDAEWAALTIANGALDRLAEAR
jgi:hypothetical protein